MFQDDYELGMRAAIALYVENETNEDNFVRILKFKHWIQGGKRER